MSLIQSLTDFSIPAATWRKRQGYLANTPSSDYANFKNIGNITKYATDYTTEPRVESGVQGFAFNQYHNDDELQKTRFNPYKRLKPFPLNKESAVLPNLQSVNPLAGTTSSVGKLFVYNQKNSLIFNSQDELYSENNNDFNPAGSESTASQYQNIIKGRIGGNTFNTGETKQTSPAYFTNNNGTFSRGGIPRFVSRIMNATNNNVKPLMNPTVINNTYNNNYNPANRGFMTRLIQNGELTQELLLNMIGAMEMLIRKMQRGNLNSIRSNGSSATSSTSSSSSSSSSSSGGSSGGSNVSIPYSAGYSQDGPGSSGGSSGIGSGGQGSGSDMDNISELSDELNDDELDELFNASRIYQGGQDEQLPNMSLNRQGENVSFPFTDYQNISLEDSFKLMKDIINTIETPADQASFIHGSSSIKSSDSRSQNNPIAANSSITSETSQDKEILDVQKVSFPVVLPTVVDRFSIISNIVNNEIQNLKDIRRNAEGPKHDATAGERIDYLVGIEKIFQTIPLVGRQEQIEDRKNFDVYKKSILMDDLRDDNIIDDLAIKLSSYINRVHGITPEQRIQLRNKLTNEFLTRRRESPTESPLSLIEKDSVNDPPIPLGLNDRITRLGLSMNIPRLIDRGDIPEQPAFVSSLDNQIVPAPIGTAQVSNSALTQTSFIHQEYGVNPYIGNSANEENQGIDNKNRTILIDTDNLQSIQREERELSNTRLIENLIGERELLSPINPSSEDNSINDSIGLYDVTPVYAEKYLSTAKIRTELDQIKTLNEFNRYNIEVVGDMYMQSMEDKNNYIELLKLANRRRNTVPIRVPVKGILGNQPKPVMLTKSQINFLHSFLKNKSYLQNYNPLYEVGEISQYLSNFNRIKPQDF